jgi:hypothetical protein
MTTEEIAPGKSFFSLEPIHHYRSVMLSLNFREASELDGRDRRAGQADVA